MTVADTTRLLDVEVGNRGAGTLKQLYTRIEKRFEPAFYATNDFKAYRQVLPQNRHAVGKDLTCAAEQHNSDTRHWMARFRRKSKGVTHCANMARLAVIAAEYVMKQNRLSKLKDLFCLSFKRILSKMFEEQARLCAYYLGFIQML